ncbi:MAG: ParB/RepB/Spo0J family partition protein [Pseudomonadota bacterium]
MTLATLDLRAEQTNWPVDRLRPSPLNPRGPISPDSVADLVESIRAQGVLQPLLVVPRLDGWAEIVAGHRRFAAAKLAGMVFVPVVLRQMSEGEMLAAMLAENLDREDLTPLQEARAYARLRAMKLSNMEIARRVGVPAHRVQRMLATLRLVPEVQAMFDNYDLPSMLATVLLKVPDPDRQRRLASIAARRGLTVEKLKDLIVRGEGDLTKKPVPKAKPTPSPENERGSGTSRAEAMERLKREPKRTVTCADLLRQFDHICGVCGDCNMSGIKEVCSACPLPELVVRLTK